MAATTAAAPITIERASDAHSTPPKDTPTLTKLTPPNKGIKGPIVECIVCHFVTSQKSIKTHFLTKHKDHNYEDQKIAHSAKLRRSKGSPKITSPKKEPKSPIGSLSPKNTFIKPFGKEPIKSRNNKTPETSRNTTPNNTLLTQDRPDVIVACVVCFEMISTKTIKGHFARHHPEHNYEALKQRMSGVSPMKSNAEMVACSACKKIVSSRTLKVHILKNHPNLDYKITLKASREGVVKNASPGTIVMKSPRKPAPRSVQLMRAGVLPPSFTGYHSEPRAFGRNATYPCNICQKEVLFQNMKKHYQRMHPGQIERYEDLKLQRTAEKHETGRTLPKLSDEFSSNMEVNNNAEDDYSPSALLKEIEQEMTKEFGMDPYSHLLNKEPGLHVQVTEQVIRFDADDEEAKYTEINPPSSKVVPAAEVSNLVLGETSSENGRKRKFSDLDYDSNPEDNELYKRLATENYMLERQILYLQEQEQFLEQKMVACQRVMDRKMRDFEQKLRTEFEAKSQKLMEEMDDREEKMKEKMKEQDRWFTNRLEEQRRLLTGQTLTAGLPSPPPSDNKSDSSKSSEEEVTDIKKNSNKNSPNDVHSQNKSPSPKGKILRSKSPVNPQSKSNAKTPSPKIKTSPKLKTSPSEVSNDGSFVPEENEDFNLSYETETEVDETPVKKLAKQTTKKGIQKRGKAKATPSTKLRQLGKLRAKLAGKATIQPSKRFHCVHCSSAFRKKWDYQKHCSSQKHQRKVLAKSGDSPNMETHTCSDYGCLICGLNFENSAEVKTHMESGCAKEKAVENS